MFSMFVYVRPDWWKSDRPVDGKPQGNWKWDSNFRDVVASLPSFSRPDARAPRRACSQARDAIHISILTTHNQDERFILVLDFH